MRKVVVLNRGNSMEVVISNALDCVKCFPIAIVVGEEWWLNGPLIRELQTYLKYYW